MKTTIHTYRFDIRKPDEKAQYEELLKTLNATPGRGHWMESHGGPLHYCPELNGAELELETEHLFNNQWNASVPGKAKGIRVFDWAQDYQPNQNPYLKQGHYLDITPDMVAIRVNTLHCGYCGARYAKAGAPAFCGSCLDSEYLTVKQLNLTRLRSFAAGLKYESPELTAGELAVRLPLFKRAQTHGNTERGKGRIAKRLLEIMQERDKAIKLANTEHDGYLWMLERGININNCIFYKHTGRFSFGWRGDGIDAAVVEDLMASMEGFPFEFDVKKAGDK